MNSRLFFNTVSLLTMTLVLVASNALAAEADLKSRLSPVVEFKSNVKDDVLTVGVEYSPTEAITEIPEVKLTRREAGVSTIWSIFAKTPTAKDDTKATISETISSWRIGGGYDFAFGGMREEKGKNYSKHRVGFSVEGGIKQFEYFQDANPDNRKDVDKVSFGAKAAYYCFIGSGGNQLIPQVSVSYNRNYKGSDKTGVIVEDSDGGPNKVKNMSITAPVANPELILRATIPYTLGSEFATALSVSYKTTGDANSYNPDGKVARLIPQIFFYYYPELLKGGGRIGIGPYVDFRTSGKDDRSGTDYGVVVDLRVASNMWTY